MPKNFNSYIQALNLNMPAVSFYIFIEHFLYFIPVSTIIKQFSSFTPRAHELLDDKLCPRQGMRS